MAGKNVFYDVILDVSDTMEWGSREITVNIYNRKRTDGSKTFINIPVVPSLKPKITIEFRKGKIVLEFNSITDIHEFARALQDAVEDMMSGLEPIEIIRYRRLAMFMEREMGETSSGG